MTEPENYTIVFEKLAEAESEFESVRALSAPNDASIHEIAEIAELRRMVLEITEPELNSYTTA